MKINPSNYSILGTILKIVTIVVLTCLLISYFSPFVHPDTLWVVPFFGLIYPIFVTLSIVLFIVHAFRKSRWSLIILLFLLLGGKLHLRQFVFGSDKEMADKENALHILSYNVRLFDLYNPDPAQSNVNRMAIIDYVENQMPDVLCFQEFFHQDKSTIFPTKDTLLKRLKITDYQERYSHKLSGRKNFGIATLSRYPIIGKGEVPLQLDPEERTDNYCIFADIVKGKDTFRIYNVHLQSIKLKKDDYTLVDENGEAVQEKKAAVENVVKKLKKAYSLRAEQSRLVATHAEESPFPVIICGDFNDTPMSYSYNQFIKYYKDAFRESSSGIGATYAGRIPAGRIDYFFYSADLLSGDFSIQKKVLSDHRAISCYFSKKPL